jgi:hypothetical protein
MRAEERRGLGSGRVANHGAAADAINLSPLLRVHDSERRHGIVFLKKKDLIADSICHLAAGGQARYKGRLHQDRQRQL